MLPSLPRIILALRPRAVRQAVYIVSKNASSPLRVKPNGDDNELEARGGLGKWAQWTVHKMDKKAEYEGKMQPVMGFENAKTGKWLAIKGGELTTGGGGEHCEFIVANIAKAVQLVKHNNPEVRVGCKPGGGIKAPANVGDGDAGRFFLFDVDVVQANKALFGMGDAEAKVRRTGWSLRRIAAPHRAASAFDYLPLRLSSA